MAYKVTAALVVAKDQAGRLHHSYQGSTLHYLNDEQREHFLRHGLVEEIDLAAPVAAGAPAVESHHDKPARTAPHKAWVDFAVSQGKSRSDHESKSKQELIDLLG